MATIRNSDLTVGRTERINQYQTDTEITGLARFYQLVELDKIKNKKSKNDTNVTLAQQQEIVSNLPSNFNQKIQIFQFAPPSDNLWNVSFKLSYCNGQTSERNMLQLYKNILAVNEGWKKWHGEPWHVTLKSEDSVEDFIRHLSSDEIGLFLAQSIQFTPFSIQVDKNPFGELQQFGGFYKNGKISKGRNDEDTLKINLLVSNWDLSDILIEPWIAAVSQNGLIMSTNTEGKYINLKADITITEYSASYPKVSTEQEYSTKMKPRKQYIFHNCFPTGRDEVKKEYSPNEAGSYKNQVISFVYDYYTINYLF